MDVKFQPYYIDLFRMTITYLFFALEYLYSLVLVVVTLPHVKKDKNWALEMPNMLNFNFDYKIIYFFYICASIPNFLNTLIFLIRKRKE